MGKDGEFKAPKGIKKQIFGSVLFFLGALNTMFAMKAGTEVDNFNPLLIFIGIVIFIYGGVQRR